jgi:hypothetical protein
MKRFLKILLLSFVMGTLIATFVCFAVLLLVSYYWQVGYTPLEWVESGLQVLEQNNKLPNCDDYSIRFIDIASEGKGYNFVYEIDFYEYTDTDNAGDIDLWYGNCQTYTVYIGLDSDCLYNKIQRFLRRSSNKNIADNCKFEKCLDFDIFVEV